MKLDAKKIIVDESRSNPMAEAMQYPECPISEICFYMGAGFGSVVRECKYFKVEGENADCIYDNSLLDEITKPSD